eukprot:CAMPEP_0195511442 /NCGR_PEP_ID=MMETSP0794_2-20130614/3755_1 /TAXON_ID=515487 /ORGANISM="Stephanopyxis turris, Strain CCMP 815" /LENGTH=360 /DNA_ID=CAMNT_0040639035 /DNA_START=277 /DNA_END=1359 /DNA_ORIENTATION=-
MKDFFALPQTTKNALRRNGCNARGYFDDELTKQRRDWKEAYDFGIPGGDRCWGGVDLNSNGGEEGQCLDGVNYYPSEKDVPGFRNAMVQYFDACAELSDRIAVFMCKGLAMITNDEEQQQQQQDGATAAAAAMNAPHCDTEEMPRRLREEHTSYLRMNYYPPCPDREPGTLGISPHTDAGFLTVLIQDEDCHSLQVARRQSLPDGPQPQETRWLTVKPVPNALTINTGDMAMIYSNGRYKAPLHRVLTNEFKERYSAPFFYNPGYNMEISPAAATMTRMVPRYHPCKWGYFRALRFAGDLTNLGIEIQISDFEIKIHDEQDENSNKLPWHVETQNEFCKVANFDEAFSVEKYRDLLTRRD